MEYEKETREAWGGVAEQTIRRESDRLPRIWTSFPLADPATFHFYFFAGE